MIIDYNSEEFKEFPKFKDGEGALMAKMFFDGTNRVLRAYLEPGSSIGYHKHETNSEIIFILEGNGKVLYEDGEERVCAGQVHYCEKGHSHSLINDSDKRLEFFAVVPEQ